MKRRGRNTSSAGDISSLHHQPSPTTDARQIPPGGDQWKRRGGTTNPTNTTSPTTTSTSPTGTGRLGPIKAVHSQAMVKQPHDSHPVTDNRQPSCTTINTTNTTGITVTTATAGTSTTDHVKVTNDDMRQLQAIKKSPSPTGNIPMKKYNSEPTHAGANNFTISPPIDQSMMMTGNYDRLKPHNDKVPSGSVTSRPVTGPIGSLHDDTASQQSLSNSINTRLAIAEFERDEYKKEIEWRDKELKQRQEKIVQLKVEMRKLQSNSPKDSHQHGHESLGQQRGNLGDQIAKYKMKERELQEELMMKEKHMMELNEKLTKKNEIVIKLNDKLTKLNEENKQLHISMVIDEEKRKTDQVRAETDREGVKQDVIDAHNEIQRLTHIIHGLNEEIETMKQEHVIEKERLLTTINDQSNGIKQHENVCDEMARKLAQLHLLVDEKQEAVATLSKAIADHENTIGMLNDQLQEKEETIQTLTGSVEEKTSIIAEFVRQQVTRVDGLNNEANENVINKKVVIELTEELQVTQIQLQEYKNDFNRERKDRERMSSELDEKRSQIKELEAKYHSLRDIVQEQKNELSMKDEAAKDWEEEKHMLTTQVNSYARQGDELKKSLSELRDKCKSLEDQLMKKIEIESEELKSEHNLVSAINHKTTKVTEIEQQKINLEEAMKMEQAEKARLQQFIAQEQAKAEDETSKLKNANKILMEKLQATEAQLACTYQSQSDHYWSSGGPPVYNYQRTSYPYHHNEQYSYSQDIPPPQMNLQQMQQYSRHALQQREQQQQQQQQLGELYRMRGEEMRKRDEDLRQLQEEQEMKGAIADRELAELEELKRKLKRRESERKPLLSHYQYSSRNEEMVSGSANQAEKKSPENSLLTGIDDEIQYYAEDYDSSLPYDPNLVCPKCGKQYRIGQIQYLRCHLEGLCHPDTEDVIAKINLTEEIAFYAEEVHRMSRPPNTEEVMREDDDSLIPYDPNLVCPKCGKLYRKGQIQYLRRHMKEFCPYKPGQTISMKNTPYT